MIFIQIGEQLKSLSILLQKLSDQQYSQKSSLLGNASIGAHTRHIIELLNCTTSGYDSGIVDYLTRERNLLMETDRAMATQELSKLNEQINKSDKEMRLVIEADAGTGPNFVSTTFYREIVYNAEHAIHHMALIRVVLRVMELDIVPDDFGMAYSTIKYLSAQNNIQN